MIRSLVISLLCSFLYFMGAIIGAELLPDVVGTSTLAIATITLLIIFNTEDHK